MQILFLTLIIYVCNSNLVFAQDTNLLKINVYLRTFFPGGFEYASDNLNNKVINSPISNNYQVIVYGSPEGGKFSVLTNKFEHRYLGQSFIGQKLPNYNYSYDTKSSVFFDDMNWIIDPYSSKVVYNDSRYSWIRNNPYNDYRSDTRIKKSFLAGMHYQHGNDERPSGDWFRGDLIDKQGYPIQWERYMHIIDPPTEWSHGSAMLWHISALDGKLYYIDVRLTRFMDLAGKLQVRHRTVSGQRLSSHDYSRNMPDGTSVTVTGKDIDGYQYVGYGISASNGTAPVQTNENQFSMVYDYHHDKQLYTLTFYYAPFSVDQNLNGSGAITISHPVYDVEKGIPTGALANIDVRVDRPFMMDFRTALVTGSQSTVVLVRQPYELVANGRRTSHMAEERVSVYSDYAYYRVTELFAYGLSHVNVKNPKLSAGGYVTVSPDQSTGQPKGGSSKGLNGQWQMPNLEFVRHTDHVGDLIVSGGQYSSELGCYVVTLPAKSFTGQAVPVFNLALEARNAVDGVRVRNDTLSVNGRVLLSGSWTRGSGAAPLGVESVQEFVKGLGAANLSLNGFELSHLISNGDGETTGTAYYKTLARFGVPERLPVVPLVGNPLNVHTPVAAAMSLVEQPLLDQRPEALRLGSGGAGANGAVAGASGAGASLVAAMPLEVQMRLNLSTRGSHLPIPGYGDRDYGAHARMRRLYLPFDAFCFWDQAGTEGGFVPAGSWTVVPASAQAAFVRAPAWVEPGSYELLYQVVALNHRSPAKHQLAVNTDAANDIAGAVVPVQITGRLYGFTLTDFTDSRWAAVTTKGLSAAKLPLKQGSHSDPSKANLGPKPGYVLRFVVNSIGPYYKPSDLLYIKANFTHISPTSGERIPVDVYYKQGLDWVLVGGPKDKFEWHCALQNGRSDVPFKGLSATRKLLDTLQRLSSGSASATSSASESSGSKWLKASFVAQYMSKVRSVALGSFRRLLGFTLTDPSWSAPTKVVPVTHLSASSAYAPDESLFNASFQSWYGEYLMPNQLLVLAKGAPSSEINSSAALHSGALESGALAVNFSIGLYRDQQIVSQDLDYGNQWLLEGLKINGNTWPTINGDVVYYQLGKNASSNWKY